MTEQLIFGFAVVVLIALLLAPFIRWVGSYRAVILKRIAIKGDEERRAYDAAQLKRFLKIIPFSRGADYFKDDRIGRSEISIKPFIEIFREPEFFFFDRQVQKALDRLIASIYELDSAQMKYFINIRRSGFLRYTRYGGLEGRTDRPYSLHRLRVAADRVEKDYRDFVKLARERLEKVNTFNG